MRLHEIINERVEVITIDSYATRYGRVAAQREKKVRLYVNPSKADLERLAKTAKIMRFIVGEDNNLYVCDASHATHFDIVHHAGIDEEYSGFIEPGHIALRRDDSIREMAPILRANPHILDAMGGAAFLVDRTTNRMSDF